MKFFLYIGTFFFLLRLLYICVKINSIEIVFDEDPADTRPKKIKKIEPKVPDSLLTRYILFFLDISF